MKFEAVLFDLDDTLLSWAAREWSWAEINRRRAAGLGRYLADIGRPVPGDDALATATQDAVIDAWRVARADPRFPSPRLASCLCDALDRLGIARADLDVEALCDAFGCEAIPGVVPMPDALVVLEGLRAAGIRTGIVTNSFYPLRLREPELAELGFAERIDICVTSGDVGHLKPHPAMYRAALDALGVAPERAVFVGDRPERDIVGANALGMTSVLFRPAYLPPLGPYGQGETPGHVVDGLRGVLGIVLG